MPKKIYEPRKLIPISEGFVKRRQRNEVELARLLAELEAKTIDMICEGMPIKDANEIGDRVFKKIESDPRFSDIIRESKMLHTKKEALPSPKKGRSASERQKSTPHTQRRLLKLGAQLEDSMQRLDRENIKVNAALKRIRKGKPIRSKPRK